MAEGNFLGNGYVFPQVNHSQIGSTLSLNAQDVLKSGVLEKTKARNLTSGLLVSQGSGKSIGTPFLFLIGVVGLEVTVFGRMLVVIARQMACLSI